MGLGDALKDNGSITASKIVESTYWFIIVIGFYLTLTKQYLTNIRPILGLICIGILHQSLVNISYGIVRDGISWYYIGSTSYVDMVLNWFINDALKAPQAGVLFWYYLIPSSVALFVLHRDVLKK